MTKNRSGLIWLWLSVIIMALDYGTKSLVVSQMRLGQSIELLPVFNLTYVHNYGAAFSFLSDAGGWQRWFLSIIAVSISLLLTFWLKRLPASNRLLCGAYSLVLAGALGNLYDRLNHGYVIDFIHVYYDQWHFPAFNVADMAICIGAGLLLLDAFTGETPSKEQAV